MCADGRRQRIQRGIEPCEHRVTGIVHDGAAARFDHFRKLIETLPEDAMGGVFVFTRQTAVARHVGVQDGREFAG